MRTAPIVMAALAMATGLVPLSAQDRPAEAPQSSMPADASSAPAAPAAAMPYEASAGTPAGPAFGAPADLQILVQQQHAYIVQLERHVAALDAYIAALRGGRH